MSFNPSELFFLEMFVFSTELEYIALPNLEIEFVAAS